MLKNIKLVEKNNFKNEIRLVGFELEFVGIDLDEIANIVINEYGGTVEKAHKNLIYVNDTDIGKFTIELDAKLLKKLAKESKENKEKDNIDIEGLLEKAFTTTLKKVVPAEVVYPPVSIEEVAVCDKLLKSLRLHGARGTKENIMAGFGLHINAEAASLAPEYILKVIQSFILLEPWLRKKSNVDLTRKVMPFIKPYHYQYKQLIFNSYKPNIETLIKDYIKYNPTRNCALDMLPLFRYIKPDIIEKHLSDKRINARPTFHYRLPNCNIDSQGWSIEKEWRSWLLIEALANNENLMNEMSQRFIEHHNFIKNVIDQAWIKETENFLERF